MNIFRFISHVGEAMQLAKEVFMGVEGSEQKFLELIQYLNKEARSLRPDKFDPEFEALLNELSAEVAKVGKHISDNKSE